MPATPPAPPAAPEPPAPDVRPFAEIARGPVATVYKAFDRASGETVLLKRLRPGADPERRARFAAEARLAQAVRHPNVVRVRHATPDALVADWVEGRDLRAALAEGPLPPPLAALVAREAARGLAAVHAAGLLHRDVTPANVLLGADGSVRLTDFGLASLAPDAADPPAAGGLAAGGPEEVRGTLATLAPEVVRGGAPTAAADLFGLGAVLAHALAGRSLFARPTASETLDAVLHTDAAAALAADPRVPAPLAAVAAALLAPAPAARPPSAGAAADALDAALAALGGASADDLAAFLADPAAYIPPPPPIEEAPVGAASVEVAPAESALVEDAAVGAEPVGAASAGAASGAPRRRARVRMALALAAAVVAVGALALSRGGGPAGGAAPPAEAPALGPLRVEPDAARASDPDAPAEGVEPAAAPEGALEAAPSAAGPSAAGASDAAPTAEPARLPGLEARPAERSPERPAAPAEARPAPTAEPPRAAAGTLSVTAEPWANVRIDGRAVGPTPVAALSLPPGVYEVAFENPAFPPHAVAVRVEPGQAARAAVSLWSLVARVTLDVAPWGRVFVGGRLWDTVPPQDRPLVLPPGVHAVRVEHPALGVRELSLRVAAGEERTVRVRFDGPPAP